LSKQRNALQHYEADNKQTSDLNQIQLPCFDFLVLFKLDHQELYNNLERFEEDLKSNLCDDLKSKRFKIQKL
jgi:hypothetical protein